MAASPPSAWFRDVFGFPEKQLPLQKIQSRFDLATEQAEEAVRKCTSAPAVRVVASAGMATAKARPC